MSGKKPVVLLVAVAALFAAVPSNAADATRETYKEAVEPICKANREANAKVLNNVSKHVREGKLKQASAQLFAAAKALKQARARMLKVPKPVEDEARLTRWLEGIKTEVQLFETTGRKLANGEQNSASKMVVRLKNNANKTNSIVLDYEFEYCHIKPAEFL
ncbi:MAG TPA: hypothetical protein VKB23_02795 [Solirubrobacterales bacterium]|nr:hypothetical protein [Solirubrobacterales bacterium]